MKTALLYYYREHPDEDVRRLAAGFQAAVVDMISATVSRAAEAEHCVSLIAGGGVLCNSALRKALGRVASDNGLGLFVPSPALCADNGAMIAYLGARTLERRGADNLSIDAEPNWGLGG